MRLPVAAEKKASCGRNGIETIMPPEMLHHEILSPLESPLAYAAFAVHWISCLICVFISLHFYRRRQGPWWIVIALAFALPLLGNVLYNLRMGLPPLPYCVVYPVHVQPSDGLHSAVITPVLTRAIGVSIYWDTTAPVMAVGLLWAYLIQRKPRDLVAPTGQT
jgi:hypothetical protein